jgi:alpha-L-rhamnosidase
MWVDASPEQQADTRVAFRGTFELAQETEVEFRLLGASWFNAYIDNEFFLEGPARYALAHPEYATIRRKLTPGKHVLAVEVIHEGVPTRIMESQLPFLFAEVWQSGQTVNARWKSSRIGGHSPRVRRINPQLGWIEWCDTRQVPEWKQPAHDDGKWAAPVTVSRDIGPMKPLTIANIVFDAKTFKPKASGELAETFGYEQDDPAARFFIRDLAPNDVPAQGVWRRYDLGKIALWRPQFTLDVPAGSVVEFAYSESLVQGRVSPWITLSGGPSCSLDHYIAKGGKQTFQPLITRGGRYVEVHVFAPPDKVKFVEEKFVARRNIFAAKTFFKSDDVLLNKIWSVGVETLDSCLEDAVIDNPTRERGQWSGDLSSAGLEIAAMSMHDLRVFRRGLVQCAYSARSDGLVAGMCPGQQIFLSSYAAAWPTACMKYWELTGDKSILTEMFDSAERNIAAFEAKRTPDGIESSLAWAFIDWGYVPNPGPCDVGMNLHYLEGLQQMARWAKAIDRKDRVAYYDGLVSKQRAVLSTYFAGKSWETIGYHRAALGLRLGFFEKEKECIAFLKKHILSCFPNDPSAPRLSDPGVSESRLITPYFAHYAMPLLLERGETDFVLDQYRKCWGWMLKGGRTTWMEVFDPRWSGCHQWSGCPTWQLSQYVLGLRPRFDLGPNQFVLKLNPGSLKTGKGRLPLRSEGGFVDVEWVRVSDGIEVKITATSSVVIHVPKRLGGEPERRVEVGKRATFLVAG